MLKTATALFSRFLKYELPDWIISTFVTLASLTSLILSFYGLLGVQFNETVLILCVLISAASLSRENFWVMEKLGNRAWIVLSLWVVAPLIMAVLIPVLQLS